MDVIDRKSAKRAGMRKYFTGEPCAYGHTVQRYTSSGRCISCALSQRERFAELEKARAMKQDLIDRPTKASTHIESMSLSGHQVACHLIDCAYCRRMKAHGTPE